MLKKCHSSQQEVGCYVSVPSPATAAGGDKAPSVKLLRSLSLLRLVISLQLHLLPGFLLLDGAEGVELGVGHTDPPHPTARYGAVVDHLPPVLLCNAALRTRHRSILSSCHLPDHFLGKVFVLKFSVKRELVLRFS